MVATLKTGAPGILWAGVGMLLNVLSSTGPSHSTALCHTVLRMRNPKEPRSGKLAVEREGYGDGHEPGLKDSGAPLGFTP